MYQHELGAPSFAKIAAGVKHYIHAILEGFVPFAEASRKILQSLTYPNTLPESSFRSASAVSAFYV